ncbi:Uncharacterized protein APZ42_018490 [Daphnia magna]|uniref:Uncharacterized protein n=1 Tax=Daphnia magna TaxID=35525 RepID=A0A164Z2I8_9CRUS|nr:Uncharacterized protein APZ42_018490 [Daphnia magna]
MRATMSTLWGVNIFVERTHTHTHTIDRARPPARTTQTTSSFCFPVFREEHTLAVYSPAGRRGAENMVALAGSFLFLLFVVDPICLSQFFVLQTVGQPLSRRQ